MKVQHNILAMNTNRMLGISGAKNKKNSLRLSSGYRINSASDDAAGLKISEKMRSQIRGLSKASKNAEDGVSLIQTAEGALDEVHSILQRMNELAVQAANDTNTKEDREAIDAEVQQLKEEITRIGETTEFNKKALFPDSGLNPEETSNAVQTYEFKLENNGTITVSQSSAYSTGSVLADKLANELIPNAVSQILNTFTSLRGMMGSDDVTIGLEVKRIDGKNGTLAYAQYSYSMTVGSKALNQLVRVDIDDFDDDDALGTGENAERLESTIAHELMHTVMQYTLTDGMSGRGGDEYPEWFIEGTAQLAGGGFCTGWNDTLQRIAQSSDSEATKKSKIEAYLKQYTVGDRPYGHGYLAAAYMGYLASGGQGGMTAQSVVNGMNTIFTALKQAEGTTSDFSSVLQATTGKTAAEIQAVVDNADSGLVDFVYQWCEASKGGAGSVITSSLNVGGTQILGNTASVNQAFKVDQGKITLQSDDDSVLKLQVGANAGQFVSVGLFRISAEALKLGNTNIKTRDAANQAIEDVQKAIDVVSGVRSYYGAIQNRLEHTIANLDNTAENVTASESRIRDTDMASTMVEYSKENILQQVGQAMLSQVMRQPEYVLQLLR